MHLEATPDYFHHCIAVNQINYLSGSGYVYSNALFNNFGTWRVIITHSNGIIGLKLMMISGVPGMYEYRFQILGQIDEKKYSFENKAFFNILTIEGSKNVVARQQLLDEKII